MRVRGGHKSVCVRVTGVSIGTPLANIDMPDAVHATWDNDGPAAALKLTVVQADSDLVGSLVTNTVEMDEEIPTTGTLQSSKLVTVSWYEIDSCGQLFLLTQYSFDSGD